MTTTFVPTVENCNAYLGERTAKYEQRAIRYRHAIEAMIEQGLDDTMTVFDIGAGMTQFDFTLRSEYGFKGRYVPVDGSIDGTDLATWVPPRRADWFVALEILEHLHEPYELAARMMLAANMGVVFSTPNPETTDVLGMDATHVIEIQAKDAAALGFKVSEETFFGGRFSNGQPDSLFGIWRA